MNQASKTIDVSQYSAFEVTGVLKNGSRFKPMRYPGSWSGASTAFSINLWHGSVWGVRKDTGRRKLLKSVVN